MTFYRLIENSANRKTGPMAVISSSMDTCPTVCPFRENGCYGYSIPYMKTLWKKWSAGESGAVEIDELCKQLKELPKCSYVRYGEVGDLPGNGRRISEVDLYQLSRTFSERALIAFTYTHYHKTEESGDNLFYIDQVNEDGGLTINLSTEDLTEAKNWTIAGYPTTCTIPSTWESDWKGKRAKQLGDGVVALICPAVWREETQCINCGGKSGPLCARRGKQKKPYPIICFPAHATKRRQINEMINASN